MNDFDDDALRDELDRRAGRSVSVATAHDAVLARSGRIRRRRAAVAGSGALVALVVGGSMLLPGADGDSRAPSDSGQPIPSVDDDPVSTVPTESAVSTESASTTSLAVSTVPPSTTSPAVVAVTADTVTPRTAPTPTVAPPTATTGIAPTITTDATSGTSPDPGASTDSSSTSSTPSSTVSEPSLAPFSRTYESSGGSISVDWNGDSFTLLTVAAAPGFEAEIEDQRATRIRVRFRGDDDVRIELRVENGQLIVDIS